jgi:hypothetical protein
MGDEQEKKSVGSVLGTGGDAVDGVAGEGGQLFV